MATLHAALGRRRKWAEAEYEALLSAHGFATQPAEPEAWRWCAARGGVAAGVGGYTCGLWLLFHATLASSDRVSAAPALRAIAAWVQDFFGCAECARHFGQFYSAHEGAHTAGHIDSSVWLWRAHNAVSLRLRASDADAAPYKRLWPAVESCKECYTEEARNGTRPMSDVEDHAEQWDEHRVFEYLQETFCFEADTFVCAGFDDPSREVAARTAHRASLSASLARAEAAAASDGAATHEEL